MRTHLTLIERFFGQDEVTISMPKDTILRGGWEQFSDHMSEVLCEIQIMVNVKLIRVPGSLILDFVKPGCIKNDQVM